MVVITDGQENSSRLYTRHDVRTRVEKQTQDYKWQFVYFGANQDTFKEAQGYGISYDYTLKYSPNDYNIGRAFNYLAANTVAYAAGMSNTVATATAAQRTDSATWEDLAKDTNPMTSLNPPQTTNGKA
jgi:hypothetical protein